MFIFNLHCQLVLRISGNLAHENTSQCKISIVPEEGWFGHIGHEANLGMYVS